MTFLQEWHNQHPLLRSRMLLLLIGALGAAATIGLMAARQPMLAIGAEVAVLLVLAILAWPNVSTLVVIFILYTNAAVVAVRFHGVPVFFGASVPALLIIPLASYLIFRRQRLIIDSVLPLIFLFLIIQVIGTLFSEYIGTATGALTTFAMEGFGLYFLITNVVRTPQMLRRAVWTLLLAGSLLGFLSLYQQITHTYNNTYWGFAQMSNAAFSTGSETIQGEVLQRRLAGPLGDQNYYAQIMLMLVPVGLFRFWTERSKWLRLLALTATVLISFGVALTFSRGAAVGFILMLVIMTFMRYIRPYQLVIILLGTLLLLQAVPEYGTRLTSLERLLGITNQDSAGIAEADASTQSRTTEMLTAGLVFIDHPVIGVGPGVFKYYYPAYAELIGLKVHTVARAAHNLYLEMAAETGAPGLLCFLLIVFMALRNLAQARKHTPELSNMATGFMLAIVSFLMTGMFLSLAYERYFWLMLALAGATSYLARTQPAPEHELAGTSAESSSPAALRTLDPAPMDLKGRSVI